MILEAREEYLCTYFSILDEMERKMGGAELTDSISHNFIVQMIPHHRAAIEMSHNILNYTKLVPLQRIAETIIAEQTKSIADMERILQCCSAQKNTQAELCRYQRCFERITCVMFGEMRNAEVACNLSADFMREMIPHHEGAVRMSMNALHFPICPELDPILDAIIVSQREGIREMQALLACL